MITQDSPNPTPFPNLQWHSSERLPPHGNKEQIRSDFSKNTYRVIKSLSDTNRFGPVCLGEMFSMNDPPKLVIIKISRNRALQEYCDVSLTDNPIQESSAMQYLHSNIPLNYPLQDTMHQIECCITNNFRDMYSIMPYCTLGDVAHQVIEKGAMNASAARNMMTQLLDGLELLQSYGIGHRDMTLENVVMEVMPNTSNSFKFVITDFGMAVKCPPRTDAVDDGGDPLTAASFQRIPHVDIGKIPYKAPEILLFEGGGPAMMPFVNPMLSDMWALGIMLLAALTGQHPFEAWLVKIVNDYIQAGMPMSLIHARQLALPYLYTMDGIADFAQSDPTGIEPEYVEFIQRVSSLPIGDLIAAYTQVFPDPVRYPHPDLDRQVLPAAEYQQFTDYVYSLPVVGGRPPAPSEIVLNEYRMQMLAHLWRQQQPLGAVTQPFLEYMTYVNDYYADVGSFIRAYRVHAMVNLTQTPVSDAAVDLLHSLLKENPEERLTIAQVRAHPWMMTEP